MLAESLHNVYVHVAEYNTAMKKKEVGLGGDLFMSSPVVPFSPGHCLFPAPRTLTIMEPTTGPLITHHRAVLSFISQQLKDRQGGGTEIMLEA